MLTFNLFAYKPNSFFKAASKGASYVLALFLFLNPIAPIFAEVTSTEEGTEGVSSESLGGGGAMLLGGGGDSGIYRDFNDIGAGYNSFQNDQSSGAFTYEYPIVVPPGRNGLTPDLKLVYNSNDKQNDSMLGYGWSLNIPYIVRQNNHGTENLYEYNDYVSSISGELVKVSTTTYYAKVEDGDFLTYKFDNDTWTVYDQNGTQYVFGSSTNSRIDDPSDSSRIYKWMLAEVRDQNDNYIAYRYNEVDNIPYPETIRYTGHGSTDGAFLIDFDLSSTINRSEKYYADFPIDTNYLISDIKINQESTTIRDYNFTYTTGHNGSRRLLSSISERAHAGSVTSVKPSVEFTYQAGSVGWQETTEGEWELPHILGAETGSSSMLRIVDVNGDSYPDIVRSTQEESTSCGSNSKTTWLSDANGGWIEHDCDGDYQAPALIKVATTTYPDGGLRIFDYNGDLLNDFLYALTSATSTSTSTPSSSVWTNLGTASSTWSLSSTTVPVGFIYGPDDHADNATQAADFNGDGLTDIVYAWSDDDGFELLEEAYVNNGSGWSMADNDEWKLNWGIINENDEGSEVFSFGQFMDLNGDGLPEFAYAPEDPLNYEGETGLNNGHTWITGTDYDVLAEYTSDSNCFVYGLSDAGVRAFDINGDGIDDLVRSRSTSTQAYRLGKLSSNMGGATSTALPILFADDSCVSNNGATIADVNADGVVDYLEASASSTETWLSTASPFTDMLVGIQTPEGAETSVEYKMSTQYRDGSDNLLNPDLPTPVVTVEAITTDDGLGNATVDSFTYANGEFYYNTAFNRQFAGFGLVTKTDTDGNATKTYFHQGNETASTTGEYDDHISKAGRPYRIEQYDDSSNLFSKTINKWDRYNRGSGASFVKLAQSVEFSYDGDSDHKEKANSYSYNNATGQLLDTTEWGAVSGSNDGTFSDSGTDDFATSYNYATTTATSTVDFHKVSRETTVDNGSNKVREQYTYYDELSLGSMDEGNPTKVEQWVSGSSYVDVERAYNSYGLVTSETDPRNNTTTYVYDTYNLYPATTTNALSQSTTFTYHYPTGQVELATDPNGNQVQKKYEPFGRVEFVKKFDPTIAPGTLATTTEYVYTDDDFPLRVKAINYLSSATTSESYTYYDGLKRKIQTRVEAEDAGQYATADYFYSDRGLLEKESLPYFGSGTLYTATSTPANSLLFTNYQYDALGRVTTASTSVGITATAYDDWSVTITDALDNYKTYTYDALGNLASVVENNGASAYTTTYQYNGNKKLTKITDAEANVRNFTYDGLGRRLTAQDLHDAADGTYGTWTYEYDTAGNIGTTTDPKSQIVVNTYDALNRPLTENYTGGSGTEVTYTYDGCTRGIGFLCSASSTDAVTSYAYNALGLADTETKVINGTSYVTEYDYDRLGNATLITYPDDSEVAYVYNDAGQIERVKQKENGGSFSDLVRDLDYGPHGKLTYQWFGNNASTTRAYDANALYRLTSITTNATSTEGGIGGSGLEHALIEQEFYDSVIDSADFSSSSAAADTAPSENAEAVEAPVAEEAVAPESESATATTTPEGEVAGAQTSTTTASSSTPAETSISTTSENVAPAVAADEPVVDALIATSTATTTEITASSTEPILETATTTEPIAEIATSTGPYKDIGDDYELSLRSRTQQESLNVVSSKNVPRVRLQKWNGELDLGISYVGSFTSATVASGTEMVKWQGDTEEVHAYPLGSVNGTGGGFEIEVLLKELPAKNSFEFDLTGYEDLDFFYQPSLDEIKSSHKCTATKCVDEAGTEVDTRPENVVGSYAVYHKGKSGKLASDDESIDYKTGKAFHIYRPKIIDATGNAVWGELSYANGKLTVTVPQEFLDKAVYPVTVDPAFGYESVGASSGYSGSARGTLFTTSEAGELTDIVVYTSSETGTINVGAAVYSDNSGVADDLLTSHTAAQTVGTTASWVTVPVTSLNITGSTPYWLWGWASTGRYVRWDTGASNQYNIRAGLTWPSWPDPMTGGDYLARKESIYAVYFSEDAPTAPTSLLTEGLTNPTSVVDSTPEFSAIYNDPNAGDVATDYRIQVSTASNFSSIYWDTGTTTLASSTQNGQRIADISYSGTALASTTPYYWRVKFWDESGEVGRWSTTTASFSLAATEERNGTDIQHLAYTYDAVGNITSILSSAENDPHQSDYAYDDLYRLTIATTTDTLGSGSLTLTIESDQIDSDLTDFPIYVDLSDLPSGFWDITNCTDIRAYKSGTLTELPREIVSCTDNGSSGTGELWLKYSGTLSSTVDTDIILTFDGEALDYADDATYGAQNVWGGYEAVYHAGEGSGNLLDITSAADNLTDNNTVGATTAGKIEDARDFEEDTSEFFNSTSDTIDTTGDFEGTMWLNLESTPGGALHTRYDGGNGQAGLTYLTYYDKTNNRFWMRTRNGASELDAYVSYTLSLSTWAKVTTQYDQSAGTFEVFVNGASVGSDTGLNTSLSYQDGAFSVGAWDTDQGGAAEWDGLMDEARFSTTLHSAAWQDAEYANQNSPTSFYTVGAISTSSATAYLGEFTYSSIGNISSSTDSGAYTYNDDGYNNPHAADSVGSVNLTYDSNGNLTNHGTSTYEWDYRNRMIESGDGSASTTYAYDHTFERVKKSATSTTIYPNQFYEATNASTTKYVFAGDMLIAYIEADGEATTTVHYVHPDHLGGTNVVTDESGATELTQAYYPFGSERISDGTANPQRGFIGEYEDDGGMSYLNARYYKSNNGQFMSQDAVFWEVALTSDGNAVLSNPQLQNSYSYAGNNPIVGKDPTGRCLWDFCIAEAALVGLAFYGGYSAGTDLYEGYTTGNSGQFAWGAAGAALSVVPAGGALSLADDAAKYSVYLGRDADNVVRYVGITGRDVAVRMREHLKSGTDRARLVYEPLTDGLSRTQARILEQSIINKYGLSKNGGTLLNRINSISPTSALYRSVQSAGSSPSVQAALKSVSGSTSAARKLLNKTVGELLKRLKGK